MFLKANLVLKIQRKITTTLLIIFGICSELRFITSKVVEEVKVFKK